MVGQCFFIRHGAKRHARCMLADKTKIWLGNDFFENARPCVCMCVTKPEILQKEISRTSLCVHWLLNVLASKTSKALFFGIQWSDMPSSVFDYAIFMTFCSAVFFLFCFCVFRCEEFYASVDFAGLTTAQTTKSTARHHHHPHDHHPPPPRHRILHHPAIAVTINNLLRSM